MTTAQELVDHVRRIGAEPQTIELKSAEHGCPASVCETMSAFANGQGGTLLLGVDDSGQCVDIDAPTVAKTLAQRAADDMEPAIRAEVSIEVVDEHHRVVRMDVPEVPPSQKPCHVKAKGTYGGSYIRGADGDRHLTDYEIDRLLENRHQPVFDTRIVERATAQDLDQDFVNRQLLHMRQVRPRAFESMTDERMLQVLGIVDESPSGLRPTLAGLLTYGVYPQQFFPQLFISVVALPTPVMGDRGPGGERFLDNQNCEGPIPDMISEAIAVVRRNMTRAAVIHGAGRADRYEYPVEVVRELIVNAVMHRDYSPLAEGTQVQVELYPDRLVVRSPGGFFGGVGVDDLGAPNITSSRNRLLAKMLSDTPLHDDREMIAENRGSGIPTVLRTLNRLGMTPPDFHTNLRRTEVTVQRHALLDHETLQWIERLERPTLTSPQVQALAMMKAGRSVRSATLQGWGLDSAQATRELAGLVRAGLATKLGDKRGAHYLLAEAIVAPPQPPLPGDEQVVPDSSTSPASDGELLRLIRQHESMSSAEVAAALSLSRRAVLNRLQRLMDDGLVAPTAPPRSRDRRYRAVQPKTTKENR